MPHRTLPLTDMPRRRVLTVALFAIVAAPLAAVAQDATPTKKKKKKKSSTNAAAAGGAKPVGKTTFPRGSEETTAERDRRLYRECQGHPNAGACAGYAR